MEFVDGSRCYLRATVKGSGHTNHRTRLDRKACRAVGFLVYWLRCAIDLSICMNHSLLNVLDRVHCVKAHLDCSATFNSTVLHGNVCIQLHTLENLPFVLCMSFNFHPSTSVTSSDY